MNNKLLSFVLGLAVIGALTSLHFYKSSSSPSSSSRVSWSTDDLSLGLQEFLPDAKELAYRISLFKTWIEENNKSYSAFEAPMRFKIWNKNYDFVQEHNAKNLSWTVEMNKFADLSREEFSALYLGLRVPKGAIKAHEESNEILDEITNTTDIVDWRDKGAVGPIRDQGQCGGCWAFSTCAAMEGLEQIKRGKGKTKTFSPQQLIDCSGKYGNKGCNGGLMTSAFEYAQNNGVQNDTDYPYAEKQHTTCRHNKKKNAFTPSGYKEANSYQSLLAAVRMQPVSIGVEADQQIFQLYKSGVLNSASCGTNIDHAILAVGFYRKASPPYWIVKNQWGTTWGDGGYIKIKLGTDNICGINMMNSYPIL